MKKIIILCGLFMCSHFMLSAQLTYGTTGLLHTPSADMQKDKTVMIGGNFLNQEITPTVFAYDTYNYFLNVTIFPFLEIGYTCTLFKATDTFVPWKKGKFVNQDRYFSFRLRALEESKYFPAVVFGTSDPFTETGGGQIASESGNGYFCRFYLAASKYVPVGSEKIGIHASYLYNKRTDYKLNGMAGGLSYAPSIFPDLNVIAEYDSKDIAIGATYLLFKHVFMQAELQRCRYFSGGLTYKIHLK